MRLSKSSQTRRGAIVPLVAICLVAILGLVALAVDIGMVAVAKTQAQNAADVAAMAGARTFNQQSGYNLTSVPAQAVTAAVANRIFNTPVSGNPASIANPSTDVYTSGDIKLECGGYYYVYNDASSSSEGFQMMFPSTGGKAATEPYTALRATISTNSTTFFGKVFGVSSFNVKATAVAAHRPRDVVIIMDLSGSMRFQSCPGGYYDGTYLYPHWGPRNKSLNPDTLYPQFGHYSASGVNFQGSGSYSTGSEQVDQSNTSQDNTSGPAVLKDFMSSGSTPAFTLDSSKNGYTTSPGGDNFLKYSGSYIKTVNEYYGGTPTFKQTSQWERGTDTTTAADYTKSGYTPTGGTFNGYTEGPAFWGKTFFVWPPDPRGSDLDPTDANNHADNGAKDWRQRFFFKKNTSTNALGWLDHNNILFNPSGVPCTTDSNGTTFANPILKQPQDTTTVTENGQQVTYRYCINYAAIFRWLRTNPMHFPTSMTTGRIKYYTTIPDPTGDTNFNNRFWTQSPMTDFNERFWKDYVDFMLGMIETGANTYDSTGPRGNPYSAYVGNGDFFAWGTTQIKQKPDCNFTATVNNSGGYSSGYTGSYSFNNVKNLAGTAYDLPGPQPITGATNASPIRITSAGHGLSTGAVINIAGVGGNTAANNSSTNKTWTVTVIDANTFSLNGSTGNGTYTSNTGSWVTAITAATNASPIVITTGAPHGLPTSLPTSSSGSATPTITVNITGVTGNTAANGKWTVTVINSTQFSLTGSTGNGTFTSSQTQWWEPVFYVRFANQSTSHELNPALTTAGILTASSDIALTAAVANGSTVQIYTTIPKSMDYADNSYRPRHQFWFGPMTWSDWLGNYTVYQTGSKFWLRWPGNVHEAQAWACKVGISAAIDDIKNNHPNDFVGMTFFSSPNYSSSGGGQHNQAVIPLGRNYQGLKDSLWFPPSTVSGGVSTITPYDADMDNVPRAKGGTAPGMGFMISYNLLSSATTNLRSYPTSATYRGFAGGLGRKGATRLVIFETDGAPNTRAYASLAGSGSTSYYPIRLKDPTSIGATGNEFPSSGTYADSEVFDVVKQICASTTASPPGYSTTRKPAQVYALGYGNMFDPANTAYTNSQSDALDFLQSVQYYGKVSSDMNGANFPDWQRIYGDTTTRQNRLRSAFTKIMQSGVQVSLIE